MTSSGWTRQRRCEYRQTTVQEPWGATPIPNVCDALGVFYANTFEMLRALETQFLWQEPIALCDCRSLSL